MLAVDGVIAGVMGIIEPHAEASSREAAAPPISRVRMSFSMG